ncbi:MAG: Myo-inositol 2-dehydrogenase [uncultured Friedmanniella sp.]|uniref:Myo-inositol 2-dehydrogenase n=1 Tax=uncultured Friedmanniella sp. TaxID=335381 RepID=A0A6J4KW15_9ACTN|nr:Gfo/Idh/MocA family oxidoreductase [uncultured Friedmanniella sp.]CAA9316663.1 MAG: Myo-inositol 2-dehydrogenase [uncultured Friedmanniella sp.]
MLRVGIIGLGEVAQVVHLPVLASLPQLFEVQSVCDLSPTLLREVGDRFGVARRFTTASELIAAGGIDAVLVLNSDEYHAECVVEALEHGLHVLVEKPMCLSRREAEAIIEARDRSGATVMVGYMRRFAPAFLEAKELLPSLGRVNFARVHDVIGRNSLIVEQTSDVIRPHDLPQSALEDRRSRGRRLVTDAIGDVPAAVSNAYRLLCGLGSHDLSAMRELLGPPQGVHSARQWRDGGYIAALLDYGDYVVCYETGVDEQLRFDAHLEVFGDSASFRVQYDTPYVRHLPTTLHIEQTSGDAITRSVRRPHLKDPYTYELEYFHACVTGGTAVKTSPEDFVADLDLFTELVRHLDKQP